MFTSNSMIRAFLICCSIGVSSSFSNPVFGHRSTRHHSSLSQSAPSADYGDDRRRRTEFTNLEPLPPNEIRRRRMERDLENRAQFVGFGDELWALRSEMDVLSSRLVQAITEGAERKEKKTRDKLRQVEQQDPELVYMLETADLRDALHEGRTDDAARHEERANAARSCLPQFNLDGLWVGKYGSHGYELINITYVGDTLMATKVTGDKNVPKGEITFQVDLNPLKSSTPNPFQQYEDKQTEERNSQILQPIKLSDKAARKWGTSQLPRYAGLGQVAEEGFRNNQWMDGQLIIIGEDYFSFAWLPIEQQIFFGRPSPELALKMLRDDGVGPLRAPRMFDRPATVDDDLELQKNYAARCLEMTHELEEDRDGDNTPLGCIWHDATDECYFE